MGGPRLDAPGPHYVDLFDAAEIRLYGKEAEFTFPAAGDELTLTLPVDDGAPEPASVEAARSALARLPALNAEAAAWLRASPGWPYGDDILLWLILVEHDNVRLCFRQERVNDEQVIGFRREADSWLFTGPDPRFRRSPEPAPAPA